MTGKNTHNTVFILLTLLVFLVMLLPTLLRQGMFVDGVTYAAISRNMAIGDGSFWSPHYITIPGFTFREHPPLAFWLESLLFRCFGDHFMVERAYSFLMAVLSLLLIAGLWRELQPSASRNSFWLPVLFWLMIQVVSWSYANNLLENTLTVFTLLSSYCLLLYLKRKKITWLIPAALFLVAASGVKGPVGLFPLAIPAIYWFAFRDRSILKAGLSQGMLILLVLGIYALIFIPDQHAAESVLAYLKQQVFASVRGERELAPDRWYLILQLIIQLVPLIILTIAAFFYRKKTSIDDETRSGRAVLFSLIIGLSASLPLVISPKQRTFYLVPAMPWFALSAAFYSYPVLMTLINRIGAKTVRLLKLVLTFSVVIVLAYSGLQYGKTGRDRAIQEDVNILAELLPEGSNLSAADGLASNWQLVAYLERKARISLEAGRSYPYLLTKATGEKEFRFRDQVYVKADSLQPHNYSLYRKKD